MFCDFRGVGTPIYSKTPFYCRHGSILMKQKRFLIIIDTANTNMTVKTHERAPIAYSVFRINSVLEKSAVGSAAFALQVLVAR